jgi:hypothetical protein
MKVLLLRPYSIWTVPVSKEHIDNHCIAIFKLHNGIWKESFSSVVGISKEVMAELITKGWCKLLD